MLKKLLFNYYKGVFGTNRAKYSHDPKEAAKNTRYWVLRIIVGVIFVFLSVSLSLSLGYLLNMAGAVYALPALMMMVSSVLALCTTMYKAGSTLFGFKDYDLLTSLPIPTRTIVTSRLLILYLLNTGMTFMLMIPAGAVYAVMANPPALFYPLYIVGMLLAPVLPVAVATLIGTLISMATAKLRYKSIFSTALMLILFVLYFVVCFSFNQIITQLAALGERLAVMLFSIYPPCEWFTKGVCGQDIVSFIIFAGISLAVAVVYIAVVSRLFCRLNTRSAASASRAYKIAALKTSSPIKALYKKELKRFFSSTTYMMNAGLGWLLSVIACAALIFAGPDLLTGLFRQYGADVQQVVAGGIGALVPFVLSFLFVMGTPAASSLSLEGKSLWIIRSLPIDTRSILLSKALPNLTLPLPFLIVDGIIICCVLPMTTLQCVFVFLTPLACVLFMSFLGTWLNLCSPRFDWETEVAVIKQGMPVMVCVFLGMGLTFLPLLLLTGTGLLFNPLILPCFTAALLIAAAVFARLVFTKGVKKFEALN